MNIKDIKYIILKFIKKIIKILKEIKTLPNVWLYVTLAIVLTFVFFIFTFPYGVLIRNELQKFGENIGRSAYVGKIDFGLIGATKIDNMSIVFRDGAELTLQNMVLDINTISAYFTNSINGSLHIENIKFQKEKMSITLVAGAKFNLDFNSFSELPIDGSLKLELQNIIANGINIKEWDILPVRFTSIAADMNISKKKLTIGDCKISGPDIKGNITGSLVLAKFFQQSQLNLNIVIDSASPILSNYKSLLGGWIGIDETGNFKLLIRGSISNPNVDSSVRKNENVSSPNPEPIEQKNVKRPRFNASPKQRTEPEPSQPQPDEDTPRPGSPFVPEGID
jgi:type II secretion system protein N